MRINRIELYAHIKWWGDCIAGIPTVCVHERKLLPGFNKDRVDGKTLGNLR